MQYRFTAKNLARKLPFLGSRSQILSHEKYHLL
jgi:hypothetical protein